MRKHAYIAFAVIYVIGFSTAYAAEVTWDGSTDMNWTEPDATSWGASTYNTGDTANFLGVGAGTVTLSAGLLPGAVVVNSGSSYTFSSGGIAGTATITKAGSGTLVFLNNNNTFTGDIAVNGGTLQVGNNNDACRLNASTYNGNISIASGSLLIFKNNGTEELAGVISGAGDLQKGGSSVLTLSGSNTYSGKTIIAGTGAGGPQLSVSSLNSVNGGVPLLPASSMGAPTTVANGTIQLGNGGNMRNCTLRYTGAGETTDRIIDLRFNAGSDHNIYASGSGLLKFTSAFDITPSSGTTSSGLTLRGAGQGEIAGGMTGGNYPGYLDKRDAGSWTLGGTSVVNTVTVYDGTLTVNGLLGATNIAVTAGTLIADSSITNALAADGLIVGGGTLKLAKSYCIPDTNTLAISSGIVHLDHGVKEIIGELWFGAVQQTNGIWGSAASTAQYKSAYFSGTGKLYVGVPIPPSGMLLTIR